MKYLIAGSVLAVSIATGAIGLKAFKEHRRGLCTSWLAAAEAAEASGYYGRAIDQLTLYFSETDCRGKSDPTAIKTLARARPQVPLPGGNELIQQLSLSRLGWQLERDPSFQLTQAKAALAVGDWHAAAQFADYSSDTQATFIKVAANARMKNWQKLQETLDELDVERISAFQHALLEEMLIEAPVNLPQKAPNPQTRDFAKSILRGGDEYLARKASAIKDQLNHDDLTIATNFLTAARQDKAVIALLDQPTRSMPSTLLKKLAQQYWSNSNYRALTSLTQRNVKTALSGETLLLVCLAERALKGNCTVSIDGKEYSERFGTYASNRWQNLFRLLKSSQTPAHEIVDALVAMEDLIKREPVAYQLLASLYEELGESNLAKRFKGAASVFNLAPHGQWRPARKPEWTNKLSEGYMPSEAEVQTLEAISPEQSILWRLAKSRLSLSRASDEGAAEALRTIRPVLGWAPEVAEAQLIAASSTAHFGDHDASYGHLMNTVSSNPKSSVASLRLSLHFYAADNGLSATELNHWWETLTRTEVGTKDPESASALIVERAMILAAIAEEEQDALLAINAYQTVLKEQPDNHVALNNLAVWLTRDPKTLLDAKRYAEAAIAQDPEQPEYQATLQDVERAIQKVLKTGTL